MNDLRWMELLEVGGVACFHDYCDKFPGVAWSLEHFLSRNDQFSKILEAETLRVIQRNGENIVAVNKFCLLYTSPSPRDYAASRMPSSA